MSDITNAGGEPDGENPVTETSTGDTPQPKKVEVNSTDSVAGSETEPAQPSPEPRRTRRGKAKQTGEAKEEAAQSPIGGGGRPSPRAKGAKAKREAVKAAGTLAEKRAKKASPDQFVATPDQKRELDSIVPELKAFMRSDVETRFKLGDALIRAGAILRMATLRSMRRSIPDWCLATFGRSGRPARSFATTAGSSSTPRASASPVFWR